MGRLNLCLRPVISNLFIPCLFFAITVPAEGAQVNGEVRALHDKTPMIGVKAVLTPDDDPTGGVSRGFLTLHYLPTSESTREPLEAVTGQDGAFSFSHVPPGSYRLSAEGPGIALSQGYDMEITQEGKSLWPFVLHTIPGGEIRGRVYDRNTGTGLAAKRVGAYSSGISKQYFTETDSEGYYEFVDFPPGFCNIQLFWRSSAEFGWSSNTGDDTNRSVSLRNGQHITNLDFPLDVSEPRSGVINGLVVDLSGAPVSEAMISTERLPFPSGNIKTDASGRFTLTDLNPEADIEIRAYKEGFVSPLIKAQPNAEDILTIELRPEAVISGIVRDEDGLPVPGTQVRVLQVDGPDDQMDMTKGDGTFRIACLSGGSYTIHAGFQPSPSMLSSTILPFIPSDDNRVGACTLTKGQALPDLEFVLSMPGFEWSEMSGRVIDMEGQPIAGVRVQADNSRYTGSAITDSDGTFCITRLPSDSYRLDLVAKGYYRIFSREGDDGHTLYFPHERIETGGEPVTLIMQKSGRVEGRIVHAETGAPIPVFEIGLAYHPAQWPSMNSSALRSYLDPEGRFSLELDFPFKYIVARAEGFAQVSVPIKAEAGKNLQDVVVSLKPAPMVEGRTLNLEGAPLPFAQVFVPQENGYPLNEEMIGSNTREKFLPL